MVQCIIQVTTVLNILHTILWEQIVPCISHGWWCLLLTSVLNTFLSWSTQSCTFWQIVGIIYFRIFWHASFISSFRNPLIWLFRILTPILSVIQVTLLDAVSSSLFSSIPICTLTQLRLFSPVADTIVVTFLLPWRSGDMGLRWLVVLLDCPCIYLHLWWDWF